MIQNLINLHETDLDKNIYRIYPFGRFLELLKKKENILVKTSLWEDPFENFILNSTGKLSSTGTSFTISSRDKYFGQCWSFKKESDAMWRIYSQHIKDETTNNLILENIGIKVKSTVKNIFEPLFINQNNHIDAFTQKSYNTSSFAGKVEYKPKKDLINLFDQNIGNVIFDQSGKNQASTLMLKRLAFTHEKEFRILVHNESCNVSDKIYSYPLEPNTCFDEIVVDPRIPKEDYNKIKKIIKETGFKNKIVQSGLYKIENFAFTVNMP